MTFLFRNVVPTGSKRERKTRQLWKSDVEWFRALQFSWVHINAVWFSCVVSMLPPF